MKDIFEYFKEFSKDKVNLIMTLFILGMIIYMFISDVSKIYVLDFSIFIYFYLLSLAIQNGQLKTKLKDEYECNRNKTDQAL